MAALILPSRRVVQPQGPVEVDRSNPIARGLVAALVPDGAGYIDYVNGTQYPATSASILGSGPGKIVALGGTGYTNLGVQSIGGVSLYASAASGSFTVITFAKLATAGAVGTFLAKSGATNGNKTLQIFNSGTGTQTPEIVIRGSVNSTSWGFSDTAFHQYAVTFDAETATARAYGDADKSLSLTFTGAAEEAENIVIGARTGGSGARLTGQTSYTYFFNRALSQSEIAEIYRNPWQLFRPIQRRIWVPVAGGGGISQTVAFTLEDVSASVSQNLSHAQSLTGTLDDVTASVSQTLSHSQSLDATLDGVTVAASQTLSHSQALAATLDGLTVEISQSAAPSEKDQSLAVTLDSIAVSIAQEGPANLIDTHDGFWAKEWARIRAREKRKYQEEIQERVEEIKDEIAEVEQQIVEVKQAPKPKKATPARNFYAEQARIVEHLIARRNQLIDEEDEELLLLL